MKKKTAFFIVSLEVDKKSVSQSSHYFGGYAAPTGGAVGLETVAPVCPGG